jgi:hypothetical protein
MAAPQPSAYAGHVLAEPMRIVRQSDGEMEPDNVNE